ncbi:MAG: 2Fe-2S iron-sulfur cluster-binding protein [Thermoanaerobaculia bacterium]
MPEAGSFPGLLEVATMVHLVLGMLRVVLGARGTRATLASIPSFLAAATPWIFSAPVAVFAVLVADAFWYAAAGRLLSAGGSRPAPRRPTPTTTLRVLGVRRETDEIRTFRLERPAGFDFLPGQYLTVVVPVEGRLVSRCYSICSSPDESRHLEISVRRQGLVSAALHESVRSGGAIAARKPAGKFVYPGDSRRPIVLLGGGVGITPLLAMLRHAAAADPGREVTLLLSVRTGGQIPFRAELDELGRRPGLRVVVTATRGGAVAPVRSGRLDLDFVRREVRDPAACVFCMCGPGEMIEGFKTGLPGLGVPPDQVRAEAFEAAKHGPGAHAAGGPFTLELTVSGKSATIPPGATLLDAAEAAGADIPSSCRAGVCQTCRTKLVSGDVECPADCLDEADRREGWVYPCVAWPKSNCSLEA